MIILQQAPLRGQWNYYNHIKETQCVFQDLWATSDNPNTYITSESSPTCDGFLTHKGRTTVRARALLGILTPEPFYLRDTSIAWRRTGPSFISITKFQTKPFLPMTVVIFIPPPPHLQRSLKQLICFLSSFLSCEWVFLLPTFLLVESHTCF